MLPNTDDPVVDFELPYEDYSFQVDPETDVRAGVVENFAVEIAALSQTAGRAMVQVDADASPAIIAHRAVWGNTAGVAPTLTRNGAGDYTLTWAASYDNLNPTPERQVTGSVNFQGAGASLNESGAGMIAVLFTPNTIQVLTYNAAGAAADIDFTAWGY
jgi:hypothetical protein